MPDDEYIERASRLVHISPDRLRAAIATVEEQKGNYTYEQRQEAARHVLWLFGHEDVGYQPGSFTMTLLRAYQQADGVNKQRINLAFPIYGDALDQYQEAGRDGLLEWMSDTDTEERER